MEQPEPNKAQIRGKDLVGAIKVMPMGLDAAIKKRTSGEFKSEQRGGTTSFSNANQTTSIQKESRQMGSFQEEVTGSSGFNQVSSMQSSSNQFSSMQSSSAKQSSSFQSSSSSSSKQMTSSNQISSSGMSMSSQKMTSSMTSSNTSSEAKLVRKEIQQVCDAVPKPAIHNQEIEQDKLKTQIVSAITDLEGDREFVDFGRENKPIDLTSPPQTYSPTPQNTFSPTKQDPFSPSKQDMFSPPPLEPMEPPQPKPVLSAFTSKPTDIAPQQAPTRNGIQNGFSEFISSSKNLEVQSIQESSSHNGSFQMNGNHEETGSIQGSSSSSSLLQKIMTPAPVEYDSGSLKRRDPRKMFTDSSFYNAKHHPTVADQVEMAHRLSSAMFNEKNSSSKGQKMYLTRVQNSGGMHDEEYPPKHDVVPNMKLVMNPEGKVHEWEDLPEDQKPNYTQVATHAAPHNLPDVVDPVAESLNAGVGKGGELFAKRRKRAENWVVDETSIGQAKPSAFADKFMQEQTQQQLAFQQQQLFEQQQREQFSQQQISQQQTELLQQQQEAQQTFAQQQQFKQEQSLEIRRQQEEQMRMAQQQIDFPQNFQHTDLKARSFTPSLDLSVHNVQGINVWANTAPRGWSTSYTRTKATPPKANPPTVSVCPATPSLDTEVLQQRMEETRIHEQEEAMRLEQEKQMMQMQQQQEQIRIQEEQIIMQKKQEEQMMIQRQQEEQMMIQQQQEEQKRIQEEQMRIQQQQEEQRRIQQQQEEQMRIQQQQEEQMRIQQQQEEQIRIQQQQEEQMRIQQQQEEQMRIQRQQEEQMRIQQQQEEQMRIQRQQEEEARQAAELQRQQEAAEIQRQEQIQKQEMERQQQEMLIQQQSISQTMSSSQISSSSSTTKSGVSDEDLEAQKRREYEDWFKSQEKEALEYSACVQYQEKASESQNVVNTMRTETMEQQRFSQQQQSSQQTAHNSSISGQFKGIEVESRPEPLLTESQLAQPPMSSSSLFESSQSQSFAQQSSSIQQSSSSYSQSQKEIYESQEFSGGVMKGYKKKEEFASEQTGEMSVRDPGVFGGIHADNNSLVDSEFDYKKHSVKDLAKHFALVKPKADIPHTILPEQRMYNGDHGPALNYLTASKSEMGSSSSTQSFMKKEISQEDFEASKQAYEMKKKQQQQAMENHQSQSNSSTVITKSESSTKSEQTKAVVNERRQSLRDGLLMDPAKAHAEAGLIDPSSILRGSDETGRRSKSEGHFGQSTEPGETDKILNLWDNHNAIARGWGGVKENYHPVTFRGIYNVDTQKNFTSQNL